MSGFQETQFNKIIDNEDGKSAVKKKVLAFKIQKSPPKIKTVLQGSVKAFFNTEPQLSEVKNVTNKFLHSTADLKKNEKTNETEIDKDQKLFYTEPSWSGTPEDIYKIEVLKSGVILNTLNLSYKSYHVIGNSLSCDICCSHDTASQFHAVLQYRKISDLQNVKGMYIYDLNSVHGTFLNGNRIKPNTYTLVRGGYIISFGSSQRKYILQTSKDKEENEAEMSAIELQELKNLETQEHKRLEKERLLKEQEESLKKGNELKGINWGIAEDVDENSRSTESSENLESDNEDLFLDDPKKALREWFKWEGYDLEYHTGDRGFGRYSCWIDLTLDATGTTERVEAHVIGDKMKAVDACALEACRVLNKYGFLRQAQEEKKSTSKNWEEVDFYDSDEDNFLDRTGVVEKKRQQRMEIAGKLNSQVESNCSLLDRHSEIETRIKDLERLIDLQKSKNDETETSDEDALDAFMSKLDTSTLNKTEIRNMKVQLHNLQQEKMLVLKKINASESVNAS